MPQGKTPTRVLGARWKAPRVYRVLESVAIRGPGPMSTGLFTPGAVAHLFGVELKTIYNVLSRHRARLDPPTYWRGRHPRLLRVLSERDIEVLRSIFRLRVRRVARATHGEHSVGSLSRSHANSTTALVPRSSKVRTAQIRVCAHGALSSGVLLVTRAFLSVGGVPPQQV